jgi:hypothetical protein
MTDIAKALAFARECLKWKTPLASSTENGILVWDPDSIHELYLADIGPHLESFLGNRFFIQIARNTTSLFRWRVIVGPQTLLGKPPIFDHGHGDSDDMLDAIFDACVAAARLYPAAESPPKEHRQGPTSG